VLLRSSLLDKHLGLECSTRSLGEELPCILRTVIHHFAKVAPEIISGIDLTTRCGHVHFRTAEGRGNNIAFLCFDLCLELGTSFVLSDLTSFCFSRSRVRTVRTKEVIDVISEYVGIGEHEVHCCTLFTSSFKHQCLGLTTLDLLDESILNSTCVGIQELRSFCTKVLKNFERIVRDLAEVAVTCACA